jgi:hypothetical protein
MRIFSLFSETERFDGTAKADDTGFDTMPSGAAGLSGLLAASGVF